MTDVDVLQELVRAAHAVVWGYGVAAGQADTERREALAETREVHVRGRSVLEESVRALGDTPAAPAAAYRIGVPAETPEDALHLAVALEDGWAVHCRRAVERLEDAALRVDVAQRLVAAARRATEWRIALGDPQPAVVLPGAEPPTG